MEARRRQASQFETSHMLAALLASSPMLSNAWRQCRVANETATGSFVIDRIGDIAYVAFSGIQTVADSNWESFVEVHAGNGVDPFSSLGDHDGEPLLFHAGFLRIFLSLLNSPEFSKVWTAVNSSKAVVFTGHSIGGTTAALTALWLLSSFPSLSSTVSILCVTFGSPLLGNKALSSAILRERWGGRFCHVVSKHDIMPRLHLAPLGSVSLQINQLLKFWHFCMRFPQQSDQAITQLPKEDITEFYHYISDHVAAAAAVIEQEEASDFQSQYTPFGSYFFCSEEGAICIDNSTAIVRLLHLMFTSGSANSSITGHLMYDDITVKITNQFLKRRGFAQAVQESSCDAGMSLALEALGIGCLDPAAQGTQECLKMARHMGHKPNLNSANLAIHLSKVTPYRAQIEWYKAFCDDHMGYYDTFKQMASPKDFTVNMHRLKLGQFWDYVMEMMQKNQLPHDFHKRAKWVNAAHFYRLLVEPLDIAEYYRSGKHRTQGHYITHGRERRYRLFNRWWQDKERTESNGKDGERSSKTTRRRFAGLTQDSCFWARVEEAREWAIEARSEKDVRNLVNIWENMNKFECYANELIERKEVSKDVLAKESSYVLWVEDWRELKSELALRIPPALPGYVGVSF